MNWPLLSSDHFDAPFRDGQAFLIDFVSEYQGYHGDYGRTVFTGEPSKPMARATRAVGTAWDEVRNAMKPGMRFSQISALGQQTLKKLGVNYTVSFAPHSVGLYHTDHVGMAGSAHLEDLTLITATGSEPINDVGDQTITV